MPIVPSQCDRCGTIFSSGIRLDGAVGVRMQNNRAGPCPNCGAMGHIADGVYDAIGDTIRVVATSGKSAQSLERLRAVIEAAQRARAAPADVALAIERDAPEFADLADAVRRKKASDLLPWLMLLLTLIQTLLMWRAETRPHDSALSSETIQQITDLVLERQSAPAATVRPAPITTAAPVTVPHVAPPRPGRNDPCFCGSGKKYKRCHGR